MPISNQAPWTVSRDLPPYRAVLVVDAKDFTGNPSVLHAEISAEIPDLLAAAFERADLATVWAGRRFPASTGDGYAVGMPPAKLPHLVHPLLDELQLVLKERNERASRYDALIRLRVSVHVGPLPDTGQGDLGDGNGRPRNDAHRLLDSVPVKAMLAASSPHTTHVAAILSARVFEDVVLAGYTGRHPDRFIPVVAPVQGKDFSQQAWLYVPAPSGNLFDPRILGQRAADEIRRELSPDLTATRPDGSRVRMRIDNNSGQVAGTVMGDMRQERDR